MITRPPLEARIEELDREAGMLLLHSMAALRRLGNLSDVRAILSESKTHGRAIALSIIDMT
jgi:hypothetical protein